MDINEIRRKKLEQKKITDEEAKKLKKAANIVFSSEEGIIVAKAMMRVSGIYKLNKNSLNPVEMGIERGKEYMYLWFIKGLLNQDLINIIESKGGENAR